MEKQRVIALIDCDAFFVSCEQKRNSELKNKPVSVLSNPEGCVISRAKEAKQLGVKMGEPYFIAKRKHSKGIYIVADHEYYYQVSNQVMKVLKEFSPYVQIYSVDEAFVDFTGLTRLYKKNYHELAVYLREKIKKEVDIPVSIGVSTTKVLAKLASDKAKKREEGVCILGKRTSIKELKNTNIDEIWGIGRQLTKALKKHGILKASEFISKSDIWIDKTLGINGLEMKQELLGKMVSRITNAEKIPKSIQNTKAFGIFTSDYNYIKNELNRHIHTSCRKLRKYNTKCMQIGVMLRTKDFKVFYTKRDLLYPMDFELEISKIAHELLNDIYNPYVIYRSTGIVLSKIGEAHIEQLNLYSQSNQEYKKESLAKCVDKLEAKFGKNIIKTGFYTKNS